MATARPKWSEIAAIVEEGVGHFAAKPKGSEWSPAEQLAVVLAPEVFGPKIRQLLIAIEDRLHEVEVILAEDADPSVLIAFAKEVGVVGASPTAERLLVENGGLPVARILASSKSLSAGAQNAIVQTLAADGRGFDNVSRRLMLSYQLTVSAWAINLLCGQSIYEPTDRGLGTWDPVVAHLVVEHIRSDCRWDEYLAKQADRIEESLKRYTKETGDTSWQDDDFLDEDPSEA